MARRAASDSGSVNLVRYLPDARYARPAACKESCRTWKGYWLRLTTRSLPAALAGLGLVSATGCAGTGAPASLAEVKPCSLLQPSQDMQLPPDLSALGSGKPATVVPVRGETGCLYQNSTHSSTGPGSVLSIYVDPTNTVESEQKTGQWAFFFRGGTNNINGRTGAAALEKGEENTGDCEVMFDAGQGRIDVDVSELFDPMPSSCDDAQSVAELIEPNTPPS